MFKAFTATVAIFITTAAYAQSDLSVQSLATGAATKAEFSRMVKGHTLPTWISQGGTSTPARTVKLGDTEYQVVTACKPHDCGAERIAVLWSEKARTMSGLFSSVNEKTNKESLSWLNVSDDLSIDGKTVLFSALTGSLENHPQRFSGK